ncbi:MAG TPA: hypothetical protein VFX59_03360 [Polyangiales bacterium]|nr:hypothetical protein [Polyangiales bacterium]
MRERVARNALFVTVAGVLALAAEPAAQGATTVEPDAVLTEVPARDSREGRELAALERDPNAKLELARAYLEASRRDGDPRYLGLAEGALQGLEDRDARVLRATILQSRHEFTAALAELETVLQEGEDAQARLTQATIFTVLAEYDRARASCRALPPSVYANACLASIDALNGADVRDRLQPRGSERAWLLSLIGEQSYWLGEQGRAERELSASLELASDRYTRALLDDLRLDRGEPADGDDLHRALSELARGAPGEAVARVEAQFAESRDGVHQREESRFWLARGERARALRLAQRNWAVQREPWDARVLLEAATTKEEAAPALAWLERTHFASPHLRSLAAKLGAP